MFIKNALVAAGAALASAALARHAFAPDDSVSFVFSPAQPCQVALVFKKAPRATELANYVAARLRQVGIAVAPAPASESEPLLLISGKASSSPSLTAAEHLQLFLQAAECVAADDALWQLCPDIAPATNGASNCSLLRACELSEALSIVPLHNPQQLAEVWRAGKASSSGIGPNNQLRYYFGENIALYFFWLRRLQCWLWLPASVGLGLYLLRRRTGRTHRTLSSVYQLYIAFWSAAFVFGFAPELEQNVRKWRSGKDRDLIARLDSEDDVVAAGGSTTIAYPSSEPAVPSIAALADQTASLRSPSTTTATTDAPTLPLVVPVPRSTLAAASLPWLSPRHLATSAATVAVLSLVTSAQFASLNIQGYMLKEFPQLGRIEWLAALARPGAFLDAEHPVLSLVPAILHSVVVSTGANAVFAELAGRLATLEAGGGRVVSIRQFSNSVIGKRMAFEALDAYFTYFYLHFSHADPVRLAAELNQQLLVDIVRRAAIETIAPYLILRAKSTDTTVPTTLPAPVVAVTEKSALPSQAGEHHEFESNQEALQSLRKYAEAQSALSPYEQFDDYMEMIVQVGYIAFFSHVHPLAPLIALIACYTEGRSDLFKLCHVYQRPRPKHAESLGAWNSALAVISSSSVALAIAPVLGSA